MNTPHERKVLKNMLLVATAYFNPFKKSSSEQSWITIIPISPEQFRDPNNSPKENYGHFVGSTTIFLNTIVCIIYHKLQLPSFSKMISIPFYGHSDNYTYMIQSIIPDNHFQRAIKSKNTKLYSQTFLFQWPKGQCCPNSIPSTAAPRPYHTLWSCKTQARWARHFAWAVAGRQRQLNSWLYFRDTRPPNVYLFV